LIKIIKGCDVFTPQFIGKKDILLIGDKIGKIEENINISGVELEIIDAKEKMVFPGFIDSHVHITGGGGEGGFITRTPEIDLKEIIKGGITTIVGTLGTDGITRSLENLYAKAKALEEYGITTFIYTGSYRIPPINFSGSIMKDIILIDKVIGVGEIAISDHRSSSPTFEEIKRIVADARVAGMISNKAGIVNFHLGDGKEGLRYLFEIIEKTEIPISNLYPTHINRNPILFEEGILFAKKGGFIDLTTSSDPKFYKEGEIKPSKALKISIEKEIVDHVTFTSDGQGSLPKFDEKGNYCGLKVGSVIFLYNEVMDAILEEKIPIEIALKVITSNPAKILKLRNKGYIKEGYDADLTIVNKDFQIDTVIAKGNILMKDGEILIKELFK
jgi:beta-aspartyl-dipeptidase (metallo-type)